MACSCWVVGRVVVEWSGMWMCWWRLREWWDKRFVGSFVNLLPFRLPLTHPHVPQRSFPHPLYSIVSRLSRILYLVLPFVCALPLPFSFALLSPSSSHFIPFAFALHLHPCVNHISPPSSLHSVRLRQETQLTHIHHTTAIRDRKHTLCAVGGVWEPYVLQR